MMLTFRPGAAAGVCRGLYSRFEEPSTTPWNLNTGALLWGGLFILKDKLIFDDVHSKETYRLPLAST